MFNFQGINKWVSRLKFQVYSLMFTRDHTQTRIALSSMWRAQLNSILQAEVWQCFSGQLSREHQILWPADWHLITFSCTQHISTGGSNGSYLQKKFRLSSWAQNKMHQLLFILVWNFLCVKPYLTFEHGAGC